MVAPCHDAVDQSPAVTRVLTAACDRVQLCLMDLLDSWGVRLGREAALYRDRAAHHIRHEARRKKPILAVGLGLSKFAGGEESRKRTGRKGW